MAKKEVYEISDPLRLLDTEGTWRVETREGTGEWLPEEETYERGLVAVFLTRRYYDADRAGFSGYVGHSVEIPVSVLMEAAKAIRRKEVPHRS